MAFFSFENIPFSTLAIYSRNEFSLLIFLASNSSASSFLTTVTPFSSPQIISPGLAMFKDFLTTKLSPGKTFTVQVGPRIRLLMIRFFIPESIVQSRFVKSDISSVLKSLDLSISSFAGRSLFLLIRNPGLGCSPMDRGFLAVITSFLLVTFRVYLLLNLI